MIGKITISYSGATPKNFRRIMPKVQRAAFLATGINWHTKALPKHFTKAGAVEYRYAPRSGEAGRIGRGGFSKTYTGRKLKKYGHTLPGVLTGLTRFRSRLRDVRATSKGVNIVLRVSQPRSRAKNVKVNFLDELGRISPRDLRAITRTMDRELQKGLDSVKDTTVVVV